MLSPSHRQHSLHIIIALMLYHVGCTQASLFSSKLSTRLNSFFAIVFLCASDTPIETALEVVTKKINLDATDVRVSAGISFSLLALSTVINNQPTKEFLQLYSIALPIGAAFLSERILTSLNALPLIKKFISCFEFCSHLPLLDFFFQCSNKKCDSICSRCKLRRTYQLLPFIGAITAALIHTKAYYHYHYSPLAEEFCKLITSNDPCPICQENYTYQRLPIELHQDKSSKVKHYICTECFREGYLKHRPSTYHRVIRVIDHIVLIDFEPDPTPCNHCLSKCPLCKQAFDEKNILNERLIYAERYEKRAKTS